jgi:hypothetical protein
LTYVTDVSTAVLATDLIAAVGASADLSTVAGGAPGIAAWLAATDAGAQAGASAAAQLATLTGALASASALFDHVTALLTTDSAWLSTVQATVDGLPTLSQALSDLATGDAVDAALNMYQYLSSLNMTFTAWGTNVDAVLNGSAIGAGQALADVATAATLAPNVYLTDTRALATTANANAATAVADASLAQSTATTNDGRLDVLEARSVMHWFRAPENILGGAAWGGAGSPHGLTVVVASSSTTRYWYVTATFQYIALAGNNGPYDISITAPNNVGTPTETVLAVNLQANTPVTVGPMSWTHSWVMRGSNSSQLIIWSIKPQTASNIGPFWQAMTSGVMHEAVAPQAGLATSVF